MSRIRSLGDSLSIDRHLVHSSITRYCALAEKLKSNHGKAHAAKLLKEFYNSIKMFTLGCKNPPMSCWRATYRNGVPKVVIKVIKPLLVSDDNHARWLLSLFSLYETWKVEVCLADLTTLTSPRTKFWNAEQIGEFKRKLKPIVNRLKRNRMIKQYKATVPTDYLSLKGGPMGQATLFAHLDARALLEDPKTLRKLLRLQVSLTQNPDSSSELLGELILVGSMAIKCPKVMPILKTLAIADKGPKVRTITVGNYYLQRSLKVIHNHLMTSLSRIPEDGTYTQDKAAQAVKAWTSQGIQPWCFDLTSATDRFPVLIQYFILNEVYPEFAKEWYSIMRKARSYDIDRKIHFEFSVGQPMGLYSSWPAFALSHHVLIRYAYQLVNEPFEGDYYIIGDDVAIRSQKAAEKYRELILSLGISISEAKSITPENFKGKDHTASAELAKRYFRNGVEISPVRPFELEALSGKGWPLILEAIPNLVRRWGEEATNKLVVFDPGNVRGHFLTWADKAHRKSLLLVSSYPRNALLKGVIPKWWPTDPNNLTLLSAWQEVESTNVANALNRVHLLHEAEQNLLRIASAGHVSEVHKAHPLHKSLTLLTVELKPLYDLAAVHELGMRELHTLGVNLDLLEAMVRDGKTYNDYQSLRLKRTVAKAQNILDIWSEMLFKFEFKPKGNQYPRVESAFTKANKDEECYW
jgi:hypothetical protein